MDAPEVVASAVRAGWRRTRDDLECMATQPDGKVVHDLRVGLRRLLAALELAAGLGAAPRSKVTRELRELLKSLSPLRDLEVQVKSLVRLGERRPTLRKVARKLDRRRETLVRRSAKRLARFPMARAEHALLDAAAALDSRPGLPHAQKLIVLSLVARSYDKFDQRRRSTRQDHHALHRVRVAFKRFRYAVEIAVPLLPPASRKALEKMKAFQDELGAIQDASVLIETLASAGSKADRGKKERQSALASVENERTRRIARVLTALREQTTAERPTFSEIFR